MTTTMMMQMLVRTRARRRTEEVRRARRSELAGARSPALLRGMMMSSPTPTSVMMTTTAAEERDQGEGEEKAAAEGLTRTMISTWATGVITTTCAITVTTAVVLGLTIMAALTAMAEGEIGAMTIWAAEMMISVSAVARRGRLLDRHRVEELGPRLVRLAGGDTPSTFQPLRVVAALPSIRQQLGARAAVRIIEAVMRVEVVVIAAAASRGLGRTLPLLRPPPGRLTWKLIFLSFFFWRCDLVTACMAVSSVSPPDNCI